MNNIANDYTNWLINFGFSDFWTKAIHISSSIFIVVLVSILTNYIVKKIIIQVIKQLVKHSRNTWDDVFLEKKVFDKLSHYAPALVIHYSAQYIFLTNVKMVEFVQTCTYIYMIVVTLSVIKLFLDAVNDIYMQSPSSKNKPIKGYLQLVNIIIIVNALIIIYSLVSGNDIKGIVAGLGAMAAVLILVFRDTILGFVASIQLSSNNMVKIGDWISMPSKGADGTILEITLHTVKVQNWDKTISTIPTYALVSESFFNWKGMEESGGRRIKRSINIDMRSVHFCSPELLDKLHRIQYLSEYIQLKTKELDEYNKGNNIDETLKVNGRRLTNLGVFRKYLECYLHNNPKIHKEMTFLVRQLQPSEKGIPIEIYVFSNDQEWASYESIQADIFDHILAIIPEFELEVFQNPSGSDFKNLTFH